MAAAVGFCASFPAGAQATMTTELVTNAFVMAVLRRGPASALLHHSDQGSQYSSEDFRRQLKALGVTCSMSRSGDVWDNSVMEKLLLDAQDRTGEPKTLRNAGRRARRRVRLHRALLQPGPPALDARQSQSSPVRAGGSSSLTHRPPNSGQLSLTHEQMDVARLRITSGTR